MQAGIESDLLGFAAHANRRHPIDQPEHAVPRRRTDAVILDRREPMRVVGALGRYVAVGTLLVIHPGFSPSILRDAGGERGSPAISVGASALPNDAGAWLRVLSGGLGEAVGVLEAAHLAAREALLQRSEASVMPPGRIGGSAVHRLR